MIKLIQISQSIFNLKDTALYINFQTGNNIQFQNARIRISKLKYKTIDKIYDLNDLQILNILNYQIQLER
jgi:hypothetical protein